MPCRPPPPVTIPADPVGSLRFQQWPSRHDAVHDPGGATPSRISTAHVLPSFDGKNSASANFHISGLTPHPIWLLSTLRTPRYRDARKTRFRPARYGFSRMRLSLIGHRQLVRTHSVKVVEIGMEFEVAKGQAAMGGSLAGSASISGGVSSAIPSICM
jgi:hypothetical protein